MGISSSARGTRPVTLAAVHTAEGARRARDLLAYYDDHPVSSHAIADADELIDNIVPYSRASWTLRSGNPISDNLEICGFARWNRSQWLSTYTVDGCKNPRQMLRNVAKWVYRRAKARGLPLRRLTHAQIRAGAKGVIMHHDWTLAMNDGTHWDTGPGFPFDILWSDIQALKDQEAPTMTTPAQFWGYDSPDPNALGKDAIQLLVDAHLFSQTAANALENVAEDAAMKVLGYRLPGVADPGQDVYWFIRQAKEANERAAACEAKLDSVINKLNQLLARP
jgi:hypothetical protein